MISNKRSNLLEILLCVYLSLDNPMIFLCCIQTSHLVSFLHSHTYRIVIGNQLKSYIFPIPIF
jgi:hypothetical protein